MLRRLRVWQALALIGAVFILPIALLSYLFVTTSFGDIDFSAKEIDGAVYLTSTWDIFHSGVSQPSINPPAAEIARLKDAGVALDGKFGTQDDNAAFAEAAMALSRVKSNELGRALIRKISDNSNLTFDPNIDSYYMVDVVASRLPDLLLAVRNLEEAAHLLVARDSFGAKVRLASANGTALALAEAVNTSLEVGFRGNPDGSLKSALSVASDQLTADIRKLLDHTSAPKVMEIGPSEEIINEGTAAIYASIDRLWHASNGQLQRLLQIRVDGLYDRLTFHLTLAGALVAASLILAVLLGRALTGSITGMADIVSRMSQGERDGEIPHQNDRNEVGTIARALAVFRDRLNELAVLEEAKASEEANRQERHRQEMMKLAAAFEQTVRGTVDALTEATGALEVNVGGLAEIAANGANSAEQAAETADHSLENMRSIAAATEEMSSSVKGLTLRVGEAATIAKAAEDRAKNSEKTVDALAEAASRIGDVVALISDVAEQTNLLALNATIEAARAGEAGRGFAVVAQEVKALAAQTTKATDEISQQIGRIQTASQGAVGDIRTIVSTIVDISRLSIEIAAAMEEQEAAVSEVARNTDAVSTGASEVAGAISALNGVARETGQRSRAGSDAVRALNERTRDLNDAIDRFLGELQVA